MSYESLNLIPSYKIDLITLLQLYMFSFVNLKVATSPL